MEVGKWKPHVDDDEGDAILIMLFGGMITDFTCPHCDADGESDPNSITLICNGCAVEYYSPIHDPKIGL